MDSFRGILFAWLLLSSVAHAETQLFDNGAGLGNSGGSPILEIIRGSRDIAIEMYEMKDKSVREALREAAARGARVRIVAEPTPMGAERPEVGDLRAVLGSKFKLFDKSLCGQTKLKDPNCFQHGKMILAAQNNGQKVALISTGNFNATNLCNLAAKPGKCNRDYTLVTDDKKVIALLSEIFESDYKGRRYDLKALLDKHAEATRKLTVSPFSKKPLIDFIDGSRAGCRLQVENQYMKDRELTEALMRAGERGVKVEITLASPCSFGPLQAYQIEDGNAFASSAESKGVKVKYFTADQKINGQNGYMHAKAIAITGCNDGSKDRAWVGSVNGSTMSCDYNREFGLFINSRATHFLSGIMDRDHNDRESATWLELLEGKKACPAANAEPKISSSNTNALGGRVSLR